MTGVRVFLCVVDNPPVHARGLHAAASSGEASRMTTRNHANTVYIVGAGIAGSAAAHRLRELGARPVVFEREHAVAGHVRSDRLMGLPYEPNGAHIFHTADASIWAAVTRLAEFTAYRHRVGINVSGLTLAWPLARAELRRLPEWEKVEWELSHRPQSPDRANFETYCISILGRTLYDACVRGYTAKQWGRDPDSLDASVAQGRIELRSGEPGDYFTDPYQGWPSRGYGELVEAMLAGCELHLGAQVTIADLPGLTRPGRPVIVTSALDDFFQQRFGPLEWRGVRLEAHYTPDAGLLQPAMVVNEPDPSIPWTRTLEPKWLQPEGERGPGTVILREFPGAPAKHYPVADSGGANQDTQYRYQMLLRGYHRNPLIAAGRLASYQYINMDVAIGQGFAAAEAVLRGGVQ